MDLFLLHGALGASSQFDKIVSSLGPSFRVHRLDFEGHGSAPPSGRPFRIEHFSENVVAVMNQHAISSAAFFGYSMGGYVALHLASTHPERVTAIATFGTKFRWDAETAERESSQLDPEAIRARVPRFADALAQRHEAAGGWELVLARTAEMLRHLGDDPALTDQLLQTIAQPVQVMVGDNDNSVTVEECKSVIAMLPNGSLHVMSGTAHPIERVDAGALANLLEHFFRT